MTWAYAAGGASPRAGRYEMLAAMLSFLGVEPDER
jgi:hypothetical protein